MVLLVEKVVLLDTKMCFKIGPLFLTCMDGEEKGDDCNWLSHSFYFFCCKEGGKSWNDLLLLT